MGCDCLSARMKELDLSQDEVAKRLRAITPDGKGTQGLISQIIKGTNSGSKYLVQLAEVLKTTPNALLYGDKNKSKEIDLENNPDYPTIKKVRLKVSAGITGFTIDSYEPDTTLQAFKAEWFTKNGFVPSKMLALIVSGESMEPTLYDGDTVVINTADTNLKDGEVFVFNLDGEVVIKRAVKDSGQWWLDSDNKNNTRFTRKACPDGICIPIGRVVQKQSMRI